MKRIFLMCFLMSLSCGLFAQKPVKLSAPKMPKVPEKVKLYYQTPRVAVGKSALPAYVRAQLNLEQGSLAQKETWYTSLYASLQRRVLPGFLSKSSLVEVEKKMRQSAVEIVNIEKNLLGSGFVLQAPSGKLYVVASYHVVGSAGNKVSVRMTWPNGKTTTYHATPVLAGGAYGYNSPDASVLELPESAKEFIVPLKMSSSVPNVGEELVVWGTPYQYPHLIRLDGLKVVSNKGVKLVLQSKHGITGLNGLCGSPLFNAKGEVVAVYSGHDTPSGLAFGVKISDSVGKIIYDWENNIPFSYGFYIHGKAVVMMTAGQNISIIEHFDAQGNRLENRFMTHYVQEADYQHGEQLFQLNSGDKLRFHINRGRELVKVVEYIEP